MMISTLKMFRALLWKEYREARPILISTTVLPILFLLMSHPIISMNMMVAYLFGFILTLSALIFMPLISRESERNLLPFLSVKPISPWKFAWMNWLSSYLLTLIPLFTFTAFLSIFVVFQLHPTIFIRTLTALIELREQPWYQLMRGFRLIYTYNQSLFFTVLPGHCPINS